MKLNKAKLVPGILACSLMAAGTANAGFLPFDSVPYASSERAVAWNNDFVAPLAGLGVNTYRLGASLLVDGEGTVTYYYYGKEAGYSNQFLAAGGAISHTTGFAPYQNNFLAPVNLGSVSVAYGVLDFGFCAFTAPGSGSDCVTNAQNDALRYESLRSIAFSIVGNSAWLFWDDSGAGPDDNHDDMLIRAVFTPATVPEPGTLGLLGVGLLGVWLSTRRRTARAA